jgi:DNA-binding protein HU-beta
LLIAVLYTASPHGDVERSADTLRNCPNRAGVSRLPQRKQLKERVMPPAKKSAPAKKPAPAAKAAPPAKKAAAPAKKAAAKQAAPVKAAPQVTVTLKQIAAELAEGHDLAKKQAEAVLDDLVALAIRHLKDGDKLRLTGLGILQVQNRAARMGRNPATGETIQIKASKKIAFRPSKELKAAV